MNKHELCYLAASELAALIRRREISPVEVVDCVLERIDASQTTLNAYLAICHDDARTAARRAEATVMSGADLPPLFGVPFSVKDLVNTAGVATTFGSRLMADNVPDHDSLSVARMKRAGAILVGKTTTPEFGHKPLTEAPLFGRTANPWNLGRTCGGSSGGAAAAAAAGLAPLAVGTDGGGSIRIPAACCGIVGLKATLGRIPHDQAADAFASLVYIGPMTRTVTDAALMLDAMSGPAACDPYATHPGGMDFTAATTGEGDLAGVRIGWRPYLGNERIDPDVLNLCEQAVGKLNDLGATVEEVEAPFENTEWFWLIITHSIWASRFRDLAAEGRAQMDPTLTAQMDLGESYSAVQVQDALRARTRLFREVQTWFDRYDLIVTPTLSRTAVPIDQDALGEVEIGGAPAGSLRGGWYPYTHPFNLTGHPAVTVPCGVAPDGLPAGLQIVAPWLGEAGMLKAAALLESVMPWADRRPDLPF
jgi:aspartyl-tRNA(Asn)/glutamyl-tRNA(Gln) amidotransferase subunit A